jgi:hypothetical protein
MASETTAVENGKRERQRSPNYPAVGLREAVERVKRLILADGKAGAPPELVAKHIGYSSAHGQAMTVVAALKKFGLVTESGGRLVPTQGALEIANLPESDPRRERAIREAALSPSLYLELVTEHSESGLPAPDVLEAELTTYKGFNPKAVSGFVADFLDTLDFAGIKVGVEVESSTGEKTSGGSGMSSAVVGAETKGGMTDFSRSVSAFFGEKTVMRRYPFDISIPRGLKAELIVSGDFTADDLERLRNQVGRLIDNLKDAFAS